MAQTLFSQLAQQTLAELSPASQAPQEAVDDPVSAILQVAQERGIDPAHLLGLAKLETQSGRKTVKGDGADTLNLFNVKDFSKGGAGIRARDNAEGSNDRYRAYGSYRESVEDLAGLLERRYPGAVKAGSPEEFARELKRGGYATDPAYVGKLSRTIRSGSGSLARPAEQAQEWDQGARYVPMDAMLGGTDQPRPAAKGEPEGLVGSMGNAIWQGAKSLGRSVMASGSTAVGDLTDVELLAAAQKRDAQNDPQAMQALKSEIEVRKKANPDAKWWQAIGDVGDAAWQNKLGTAQLIANQAPNSAVALGGGWAGGLAGAKLGALAAPFTGGLSVPVGATVGALAGMFLGNYAMESGGKALEKAEGGFTQDEANASMTEGAKKAAVVTGVDALTLGAGKLVGRTVFGAPVRAGARAEAQVLADAGVDITNKAAIAQALATNQALKQTAIEAGKQAAKGASKVGTRVAQAGTGMAMEALGEGAGEYFGEELATGKGDIYDAALEALSSATQSVPQTAMAMRSSSGNELDPSGIVRAAKQSGGIVSRAGLAATPGAQQPSPAAPSPAATQPTAVAAPGAASQPAAGTAAGSAAAATTTGNAAAASPAQPAQTPIQASAMSAIEQALEADKQRRRAADEVVEDEVEEGDVVAAGDPAAVDPPEVFTPPAMQVQPTQPAQPASAGFSLPAFDNSLLPKTDPAAAEEQRRQFAEFEQKRKNRRAGTRSATWERNPFMAFLGANGLNRDTAGEFAPGLTERRKAFVPGYGPVFRPGAKNLDELVQTAREDGFLRDDDGETELYDLIDRALRGERIAPLFADGAAEAEGRRRQQAMQEREGATFEDYLAQQANPESEDFDPLASIGAAGYDFGDDDLADYAAAAPPLQAEVSALAQHYYDLGFDPDEVLERLSIEAENQPEQAYYDRAKSRFTQLIEQALNPGRPEGSAKQGGSGAVRRDTGPQSDAQADAGAAGSQAAPVTPPAAPIAASPKRADAIRAKLDDLKAQGFSQFTKSGGRTLLLNPDTYETVELTPAEKAVAKAAASQAKAGLQSLRGQRKPAQVDQRGADVLQSYTPADVLAQGEQAQAAKEQQIAEQQAAADQAKADDERKRIEQASYAAADSFELGQNPLDSLTGQRDIFSAVKPVAQDLAGKRINDEWTAFDPQSGTLGIPRAEMPQIKAEHRGAMMGFLKARGIDGQQETIPSAAIKPTQAEFSPAKVKKAMDREGGNRSIIVSADGYVVDGHHQWLAAREKGEPIPAIRLDQNIGDVLTALKDMPSAQPEQGGRQDAARDYESDMRLYPSRVLEQVGANGELAKLYAKAGVRGADAFGGLSADDRAAAYAAFVADGGKPAGNLPQSYNDSVMEEERQIRRRQLQDERTINQDNGKPFKTAAGAKSMLDQFDLGDTHKIVSEGSGYALRQMPAAERAEVRRKAEGRESYMEAQAAVIAEMGIPVTADGEIDATDEQWDEIDQRIAERLGQQPIKEKAGDFAGQLEAIAGELDAIGAPRRAAIVREWMNSDLPPSAGDVKDAQDLLDQVKMEREPDPVAELLNQHFKLSAELTEAFNSGKGDAKNQLRLMDESDQVAGKLIEAGYTQDQLGANALRVTVDHFKGMVKEGLYSREYGARDELFKKPASLPPTMAADEAPELADQWAAMTPEQRRRSRLEREIATGMTNNGGVMAKLRPSAIEKRKQELAAMGESGQLTATPTTQESQAERGAQPDAGPQSDEPITSRPFATAIEKTKTGWKILGNPDALADHARDLFGKGVVKRKDGISLATKNPDVAGNFPVRFDEYLLADLPDRHGRIEVRVNQDGSASVRSLDGGYMGPQLPSVAEAIANHRNEFGGSDSSIKQADAQPAGSTAAANEATKLKTVRDVADKLGMEYVSGLLADSLKKGQAFSLQGKKYTVTAVTDSRIRFKSEDGKNIEALKYGNKLVSGGNAKSQPYAQFVRDLEGVISVDLINENNPFHKPSEVFALAQKALDALPADMKEVRPEIAEPGIKPAKDLAGNKRDTAPTLEEVQAETAKSPLEKVEAELADWKRRRALPTNQAQVGVIDEEIAKLEAQVKAMREFEGQNDELDGKMQGYERKADEQALRMRIRELKRKIEQIPESIDVSGDFSVGRLETNTLGIAGDGWYVLDKNGKKASGQYRTKAEAERLRSTLVSSNPEREALIKELEAAVDALAAMRDTQNTASKQPAITADPDLEAIFDQLDGITQRTQAAGQQAAAAHPQAERIQFVQKHILDILEDLEGSGKVTINC